MGNASSDSASIGAPIDYVVILGCRLDGEAPGKCLASRIDTAADFLKKHPFAMAVCSGGQGSDEVISEAQAIASALERHGIPKRRILLEDASHNTYENLSYTKAILDARTEGRNYRIAIVTNDFHVYRARRLANYLGFSDPIALSAKTPTVLFYQNILREIASVVLSRIRFH